MMRTVRAIDLGQRYPPSAEERAAFEANCADTSASHGAFDELIHGAGRSARKRNKGGSGGSLTHAAHFTPQQAWPQQHSMPLTLALAVIPRKLL